MTLYNLVQRPEYVVGDEKDQVIEIDKFHS
jgi:hypothetical protein